MAKQLVVVESRRDWDFDIADVDVVEANEYLSESQYFRMGNVQVVNLCRGYRYQSLGYYCSLLAEARGHRTLPAVATMLDLSSRAIYGLQVGVLDKRIQKKMTAAVSESGADRFALNIFFGVSTREGFAELGRELFELFPCPLLQAEFERAGGWRLNSIRALQLNKLSDADRAACASAFISYRRKRPRSRPQRVASRYDLAILHNPEDPLPPSDQPALQRFIKAGRAEGLAVELITRKDYGRLAEFDALFIRDTTRVDHYTFRFAKRAESEGMVVIDDPCSIMRCTNKVYLAELLRAHRVPTPRTKIVAKKDERQLAELVESTLEYPVVLKVPDGSFSQGVSKAEDARQLVESARRMFKNSELILVQEYLYTDFDWRVGILNRTPVFVCQYFMSEAHWQIVKHGPDGSFDEGGYKSWAVGDASAEVVEVALRAANLIGDGFYGVDVKQNADGVYVIEVNDNPNLEAGVEDSQLGLELYRLIMRDFVRRLDLLRFGSSPR